MKHNYDINTIINAFLTFDSMTVKKIRILCFYAQSWFFYLNREKDKDKKLLDIDFEAWVHGPSCMKIHETLETYRLNMISNNLDSVPKIEKSINEFTQDEDVSIFLKHIYMIYGNLDEYELEDLVWSEKPWRSARGELFIADPCHNKIEKKDMIQYCYEIMSKVQPDV